MQSRNSCNRGSTPSLHNPRAPIPGSQAYLPSLCLVGNFALQAAWPGVKRPVTRADAQTYLLPSPHPFKFPNPVLLPSANFRKAQGIWTCQKIKPLMPAENKPGTSLASLIFLPPGHLAVKKEERKPRPLTLSDRKQKTTGCPRRGQKGGAGEEGKDDVFRLTLERFPDGANRGFGESLPYAHRRIPA